MKEAPLLDAYQRLRRRVRESVRQDSGDPPGDQTGDPSGARLSSLVEGVAVLPDLFHLTVRLLLDGQVPLQRKLPLGVAVAYLVSPLDLVLDAVPVVGLADDLVMVAWALRRLLDTDDPAVAAAVARHWAGERDALEVVREVLALAQRWVGRIPSLKRRPPGLG